MSALGWAYMAGLFSVPAVLVGYYVARALGAVFNKAVLTPLGDKAEIRFGLNFGTPAQRVGAGALIVAGTGARSVAFGNWAILLVSGVDIGKARTLINKISKAEREYEEARDAE